MEQEVDQLLPMAEDRNGDEVSSQGDINVQKLHGSDNCAKCHDCKYTKALNYTMIFIVHKLHGYQ